MENNHIIIELNKLIDYCQKEFDLNDEAYQGISCPYDEGKYLGAKEAYADVAYKLMLMKNEIMEGKQ